jgi:hypothetical protein
VVTIRWPACKLATRANERLAIDSTLGRGGQRSHDHPHPADTVGNAAAEHGEPANGIPDGPGGAELEQRVMKPVADGLAGALPTQPGLVVTETVARASGGIVWRRDEGGAVIALPGSAGADQDGSQLFTQDSPGVPGGVEFHDFFGEALAAFVP